MDAQKLGRMRLDRRGLNDPSRILGVSRKPVLDLGELWRLRRQRRHAVVVFPRSRVLYLYYVGWQRTERTPYMLYTGSPSAHDEGETFRRVSRVPIWIARRMSPFSRGAAFVMRRMPT